MNHNEEVVSKFIRRRAVTALILVVFVFCNQILEQMTFIEIYLNRSLSRLPCHTLCSIVTLEGQSYVFVSHELIGIGWHLFIVENADYIYSFVG